MYLHKTMYYVILMKLPMQLLLYLHLVAVWRKCMFIIDCCNMLFIMCINVSGGRNIPEKRLKATLRTSRPLQRENYAFKQRYSVL